MDTTVRLRNDRTVDLTTLHYCRTWQYGAEMYDSDGYALSRVDAFLRADTRDAEVANCTPYRTQPGYSEPCTWGELTRSEQRGMAELIGECRRMPNGSTIDLYR